jgi:oxygen-dependent protoporphyrinogen oxidase
MGPVVVVGAGIAGLTAAFRLSKAGVDVTVLEASDHVGGRMSTDRREGYLIDRGAQFLSDGYGVVYGLIDELGLAQRLSRASGWTGTVRSGTVRRISARYPWTVATSGLLGWRDALRMARASRSLVRRTRDLSLSDYSQWHALDDADAAEWVAEVFGEGALEYVFEPMLEGFYFQAPERMSRAWPAVVWNFGARRRVATTLSGGVGSLPEALAQEVDVRLATPAEEIDATGPGVRVRTAAGWLEAAYVVLATTAPTARRLHTADHDAERRLLQTGYSSTINISFATRQAVSTANVARDIYGLLIPRRERQVIASIAIESRKCGEYVRRGELMNVMLSGSAGCRLLPASDDAVLSEVLPELQRYFPEIEHGIEFAHVSRWPEAEPCSPVGRSRDLRQYRQRWHPGLKVVLAGDYMSIPCTEGAAESGQWAARALIEASLRRSTDYGAGANSLSASARPRGPARAGGGGGRRRRSLPRRAA